VSGNRDIRCVSGAKVPQANLGSFLWYLGHHCRSHWLVRDCKELKPTEADTSGLYVKSSFNQGWIITMIRYQSHEKIRSINFGLFIVMVNLFSLSASAADVPVNFNLSVADRIPSAAPFSIGAIHDDPVIRRGLTGEWDAVDVLNPSIVRYKGRLINYFSGYDGVTWRTGIATSEDGISWEKFKGNPILSPGKDGWDKSYISANGAAIVRDGKIIYYFQGVDDSGITRIGLATSSDDLSLAKLKEPVLSPGPSGTWESMAVADPYVIQREGVLYLYYLGMDDRYVQRIGVARSNDGIHWERFTGNPILDVGAKGTFDENGIGEPSIAYNPPYYYLIYTGRDSTEKRNLGWAISLDGTHWKKMSTTGILSESQKQSWYSSVICDTTLLQDKDGQWRLWFGGGNIPKPDQNINGQIGVMTISLEQNRPIFRFSVEDNWERSLVKSTDILKGSYAIDGSPGGKTAWVGPNSHITLMVPELPKDAPLQIEGWVPAKMIANTIHASGPQTISFSSHGKYIYSISVASDQVVNLTIPRVLINDSINESAYLELDISSNRSYIPSKFGIDNDKRDLSFIIKFIGFK
jgi:predicted GH43/DUF377 family glycosyl hydrolase